MQFLADLFISFYYYSFLFSEKREKEINLEISHRLLFLLFGNLQSFSASTHFERLLHILI